MPSGKNIKLEAVDGRRFPAYLALPDSPAAGALVVLPEIFGVNAHIRAVVDGYAQAGFAALAPATFDRIRAGVELGYAAHDVHVGVGLKTAAEALPAPGVLLDVQAAIDHAAATGARVGVVGFCWGGLLAWRAACTLHGLAAAVVYYGGGMTQPDELARQPRVPTLAHLSDHDPSIPLSGVEALRQAHPEVEVHLYAASHGFNCDQREAWNADAARAAGERTRAFFTQHLA